MAKSRLELRKMAEAAEKSATKTAKKTATKKKAKRKTTKRAKFSAGVKKTRRF